MSYPCPFADSLPAEHRTLCREYASIQERCSRVIAEQRAEIAHLQAQVLRLRAAAIVQVSALAFAREDHAQLEHSIPGLPRRVALVRRVEALAGHVHALMAERLRRQWNGGQPLGTGQGKALPAAPDSAAGFAAARQTRPGGSQPAGCGPGDLPDRLPEPRRLLA